MSPKPAFSRPLPVSEISDGGIRRSIAATPAECEALAKELRLPSIGKLEAKLSILPRGRRITVTGEIDAIVTQVCVVSLEPFEAPIREPVEIVFSETPEQAASADPDEELPDPVVGGAIDLGAVAAEFLALSLDPHPRKPGVSFDQPGGEEEAARISPFAALRGLKPGDGKP